MSKVIITCWVCTMRTATRIICAALVSLLCFYILCFRWYQMAETSIAFAHSPFHSFFSHFSFSFFTTSHLSTPILYLYVDTHYPTSTTHSHSTHPSHPLQLQDSYGTAVRSATKLLADGEGDVQQERWVILVCLLLVFYLVLCLFLYVSHHE